MTKRKAQLFKLGIWVVLTLFQALGTNAQSFIGNMDHIGLEEGMPARMVYQVVQDREGFIWFCTQMGIHRYDGHRFKTLTNSELGLPSQIPANLSIDTENRLWFSCAETGGIPSSHGVLDLATDQKLSVSEATNLQLSDSLVLAIGQERRGQEGILILLKTGDLYRYNQQLQHLGSFQLGGATHVSIEPISENEYWARSGNRILLLKEGKGKDSLTLPADFPITSINMIHTPGFPLVRLGGFKEDRFYQYINGEFQPLSAPEVTDEKFVQPAYLGPNYRALVFQDSIKVFAADGTCLIAELAFRQHPHGNKILIYSSFLDRQSNLWIASVEGLYKVKVKENPFKVLFPKVSTNGLLVKDSSLWIGGHPTLQISTLNGDEVLGVKKDIVYRTFFEDSRNRIWSTGFLSVIQKQDSETGERKILDLGRGHSPTVLTENQHNGSIWIGMSDGILELKENPADFSQSQLESIWGLAAKPRMTIRHFHQNEEGIWAVGTSGLILFDPKTRKPLANYGKNSGFPISDFNHLHEDAQGIFWIATRGAGLLRWDRKKDSISQFTQKNGLTNDNIYAVYEDEFGKLWLPSDYGLMAFDKVSHNVRAYHTEHGIAHEEFNTFSHYRGADGTLYFGGLGGVTIFHPRDLQANSGEEESPLSITRVSVVDDQNNAPQDRSQPFMEEQQIVLAPDDRVLEIEVGFLDYDEPSLNQISYRLKGYQENWAFPEGELLSFMNLPYGKFVLEIRARGASGNWKKNIVSIPILVKRPFYLQTWFILSVLVAVLLLIWGGIRWRVHALKQDRIRLEREVSNRTATIAAQAEELKELDHLKTNFFANITHEIRTPLTLLIGPLEELMEREQEPATRKALSGIRRNAHNLLNLINQLLDISKLEHRQMKVEIARGNMAAFTQELLDQFAPIAEQKGLKLSFTPTISSEFSYFDPDKWGKIIFNLISNAVKFTPAGGSVAVSLEDAELAGKSALKLVVKDSGIGIPDVDQSRLFDRFYQVDSSSTRRFGGTGIGLALVKELVDLQGGKISVHSEEGAGTTFTVLLPCPIPAEHTPVVRPLEVAPIHTETPPPAIKSPLPEAIDNPRLTLLLIEDDTELRSFVRSCIDEHKYQVIEAADGEEGVAIAMKEVPDLIISDVMMPKKNGFEVVQEVRNHPATSHIPLILLTAKASLESRLEGLERGADVYLTKPFVPQELKTRIDKLIEIRQILRERYRLPAKLEEVAVARAPEEKFRPEDDFMERLRGFIQENLTNPDLKVDLLAREFGMSRTQFYRKLSSLADVGVSDMIRCARCEYALALIREGEMNLSEIAYEVGYSSPAHFSRSFKKQFNILPSEVLKNLNQSEPV